MIRVIEIETSQFSDSPTKRWVGGTEIYVEDAVLMFPDSMDDLDDNALGDMAANEQNNVRYLSDEQHALFAAFSQWPANGVVRVGVASVEERQVA